MAPGATLVAMILAAAACGDDTSTDDAAPVATSPVTEAVEATSPADTDAPDSTVSQAAPPTVGSPATTGSPSTEAPADAAFPVTIEHAFGSTTIESEPQRIVSLGFTDHDVLLALGVEPIAIRAWYGDYEYVWPWAEAALGDLQPEVIPSGDLSIEQIAALDPDLIIGLQIGLEAGDYDLLSRIAPTVAQSGGYPNWGTPWQVNTITMGQAVGKADEAAALVADVEGQFAAARAAHPEWEGVELVYGEGTANFYVETDGSTRMKVLQDLGFVVPEELAALGSDTFYHDISAEQIEMLDHDIVLWEPAVLELMPEVEANSIYQTLAVSQEDRDIFMIDPVIAGAMAHADVLSLPIVLDFLVPELERAVANLSE